MTIRTSQVFRSVESQGKKMTKVELYEWITELMIDNRLLGELVEKLNRQNEKNQKELELFLTKLRRT